MPEPAPPAAEPESATPGAVAEPASRSTSESPADLFAAGLRERGREALKPAASRGERPNGEAASEESAEPAGSASKPEASAGEPSRRGAAARISEQQAEIDRLVAEKLADQRRAEDAEGRVTRLAEQQEAARRAVLDLIGDDARFEALQTKRMRREPMSYEDDEELDRMLTWRERAAPMWELTERAHKTGIARGVATRAEKYGLDKDVAFGADIPGLIDHVAETTEARVRKESADRITGLEAELKGLRTKVAAYEKGRGPTAGGSSSPPGDVPDDGAPASDWFAHGIRTRQNGAGGMPARAR